MRPRGGAIQTELQTLGGPLAWTVAISSLAGLATVLRGEDRPPFRMVVSAVLSSAVAGTIVAFALSRHLEGNLGLLIAVSGLAGAGGASSVDFMLSTLRTRARRTLGTGSATEQRNRPEGGEVRDNERRTR